MLINLAIAVSGANSQAARFSCLLLVQIPDGNVIAGCQVIPRWSYYEREPKPPLMQDSLFDLDAFTEYEERLKLSEFDPTAEICSCGNRMPCGVPVTIGGKEYIRHDNIMDEQWDAFRAHYSEESISKDDIFYYCYGILHSQEYVERYQNNLRREMPRIPMAPDFWAFSMAGRRLGDLHIKYDDCPEYPLQLKDRADYYRERDGCEKNPSNDLRLTLNKRMTFIDSENQRVSIRAEPSLKHTLAVNDYIKLTGIPPEAHLYLVNGKTPIHWIINEYYVQRDKDSGIVHDPNDWFRESGDNIVSKIKRTVWMTVQTVDVLRALPNPFEDGWSSGKSYDEFFNLSHPANCQCERCWVPPDQPVVVVPDVAELYKG